jgi:aminoglycoside phosphotransferase (APT) family kinase protein
MRRRSRKPHRPIAGATQPRRSPRDAESEPRLEGEDWVEWGDQRIWAAGFTSGGAPYGLTEEEMRESSAAEGEARGADWARAKRLLEQFLANRSGPAVDIEIGWVKHLGSGLCRKAFTAEVSLSPDPGSLSGDYVVLLALPNAEPSYDDRARFEARLLTRLSSLDLPLRIPRLLGLLSSAGRPVLLETRVSGFPLDLRAGRQTRVRPWDLVAQVAAAVHALDSDILSFPESPEGKVPGPATRRDYALAKLSALEGLPDPVFPEIHAWGMEHLPGPARSVLLHGDLLGQNILLVPGELPGLIDWEWAHLGDPAYDLAIVTRGARRPFQLADGLDRLLESYAARSIEIRKEHVHLYELCLMARQYVDALAENARTHPPDVLLDRIYSAFRRVSRRG